MAAPTDTIEDIIAVRQLQQELLQLKQARIEEASEGFGEQAREVEAHNQSLEQQQQALDYLTQQYITASRQEAELKDDLLTELTQQIETEESNLATWTQQCDTAGRAFETFEAVLQAEIAEIPKSPRSPSINPTRSPKSRQPPAARAEGRAEGRASILNFSKLRSKRAKAREQVSTHIDNSALLDSCFTRLRQHAETTSLAQQKLALAREHYLIHFVCEYYYELQMHAEVSKERKQQKAVNNDSKPCAAKPSHAKPKPAPTTAQTKPTPAKPAASTARPGSSVPRKPANSSTPRKPGVPTRSSLAATRKKAADCDKENPKEIQTNGSKPHSRPGSGSQVRRGSTGKEVTPRFK